MIELELVTDCMMYVVYDDKGNRRGAFDDEPDAQAFLAIGATLIPVLVGSVS